MEKQPRNDIFLVCDIGNSGAKFGIASPKGILAVFTLPAREAATTKDSLGLSLAAAMAHHACDSQCRGCLAVSVVPAMNSILAEACAQYLGCQARFIGRDMRVPLHNRYDRPQELGLDRLTGAWGARLAHPQASHIIVVDYGTAITFDCLAGDSFEGGLIFPGLKMATAFLDKNTAQLPWVMPESPPSVPMPPKNTQAAIACAILPAYAALTRELCGRLEAAMGAQALKIASGGQAGLIAPLAGIFADVRPNLVLDALAALFNASASQDPGQPESAIWKNHNLIKEKP